MFRLHPAVAVLKKMVAVDLEGHQYKNVPVNVARRVPTNDPRGQLLKNLKYNVLFFAFYVTEVTSIAGSRWSDMAIAPSPNKHNSFCFFKCRKIGKFSKFSAIHRFCAVFALPAYILNKILKDFFRISLTSHHNVATLNRSNMGQTIFFFKFNHRKN